MFICPVLNGFIKKTFLLIVFALLLGSCSRQYVPVRYQYTKNQVKSNGVADERIAAMIQPYKDSLERKMNAVIVENEALLSKAQPEGALGNLLADIMLEEANLCCSKKVDIAVINNGGIRVPELGAGKITLGKVYEIMPFENKMVLVELSGSELLALLNTIAQAGGWPVSGVRLVIRNKKAENVTVGGKALEPNNTYTIAISDYLAEGGDNLTMLKDKPTIDSRKSLRDVFISGFERINAKGEKLKSRIDGRVSVEDR